MTARSLTLRGTSYPLVLPSLRDPRLHVAAVIITIHVLGQVALDFRVSIPQILAAIITCAVIEIAVTFRQARAFVWPASAMLTGSGVALILRAVGTEPGDHWTFDAWYVFAGVAALSLVSKYVIKYRGTHVFNPSNIGLVVAFLVLGSSRVEPLDFWWGPLDLALVLAYLVIIVGGLLITRRLKLLGLAVSFWLALAVGLGVLAASGHCMVANWAFAPVCGTDFWRVIVTSPEVLIFLFFMITDPRTVPAAPGARVVFGVAVAAASVLLMAPQTDEFGAKVGLLSGLVVVHVARPLLDRFFAQPDASGDGIWAWLAGGASTATARRAAVAGVSAVLVVAAIIAAGTPARGTVVPDSLEALNRPAPVVDPSTLPPITIDQEVIDFDHERAGDGMNEVVVALSQDLALETRALLEGDDQLLAAIDHGDRLAEMQGRLQDSRASGATTVEHYTFDEIHVTLLVPFGVQSGLSLGLTGRGTVVTERYDADGTRTDTETTSFHKTFAMRQATGARWMLVGVLPPDRP